MARRIRVEGTIFRRHDGRWEGRLRVGSLGAKHRRESFYGASRQEVPEQMRSYASRHVVDADLDFTLAEYLASGLQIPSGDRIPTGCVGILSKSTSSGKSERGP